MYDLQSLPSSCQQRSSSSLFIQVNFPPLACRAFSDASVCIAPVEDCPCFEDAVAFVSVFAGIMIGRNLHPKNFDLPTAHFALHTTQDRLFFPLIVCVKELLGIFAIFTYRLAAKKLSHAILPSIFRAVQPLVVLSRRHYADTSTDGEGYKEAPEGMKPVPSLLDLASLDEEVRVEPVVVKVDGVGDSGGMRRRNGSVAKPPTIVIDEEEDEAEKLESETETPYIRLEVSTKQDADVLTKVSPPPEFRTESSLISFSGNLLRGDRLDSSDRCAVVL